MVIDNSLRTPTTAGRTDLAFSIDMGADGNRIRLCGELDQETASIFTCVLNGLIAHGRIDLDLDLERLTFFDLRGFSAVHDAQRRLAELGGRLRVINANHLFHTVAAWWGVPDLCDDAPGAARYRHG